MRSNVLPMDVELERDYYSESSKSALRAVFSQWSLTDCRTWWVSLLVNDTAGLERYFKFCIFSIHNRIFVSDMILSTSEQVTRFSECCRRGAMQALLKKGTCRLEQELGLQLAFEEGSSKYFPASNSAQEVRDCLVAACLRLGVKIRYNAELAGLANKADHWHCQLAHDSSFESSKIVST